MNMNPDRNKSQPTKVSFGFSVLSYRIAYSIFGFIFVLCSCVFSDTNGNDTSAFHPDSTKIVVIHFSTDTATQISAMVYADYLMAMYNQQFNQSDSVVDNLRDAIELMPNDANLELSLAKALYANSEFEQALSASDSAKQLDPELAEPYLLNGKIYVQQQKATEAINSFSKATALDPDSWESYFQLASLYQAMNRIDDAMPIYQQAANLKREDFLSPFRLGELAAQKGKYPDAIKYYQKTIEIAPRYVLAYLYLGFIFDITGQTNDAASTYRAGIAIEPGISELHQRLAGLYQRQQKYADAILEYEITLAQDTENTYARFGLGESYFSLQQYDSAQRQFTLLTNHKRLGIRAQFYLGLIAEIKQNYLEALDHFTTGISLDTAAATEETYYHIYSLFKHANKIPAGISYFQGLLKNNQNQPAFYLCLVWAYSDIDRWEEAKQMNLQGLQVFPRDEDLVYQMGIVYDKLQQTDNAIKMFQQTIEINPKSVDAYNYLGYMYAEKGIHLDDAEKYVKQALTITPNEGYILDSLGWVYFKQGKLDAALLELNKAVSATTTDAVIYDHLGDVYWEKGEINQAKNAWQKALQLEPQSENIRKKLERKK